MSNLISFPNSAVNPASKTVNPASIDVNSVRRSRTADSSRSRILKQSAASRITAQSNQPVEAITAPDRAADPIKSVEDIRRACSYLLDNHRYRDHMLLVMGINFGLRISDLQRLRFTHILNEDFSFKESFEILEKKTASTRKRKKNRYVVINDAVMDAVELYLEHAPYPVSLFDLVFRSESNNRGAYEPGPLNRRSVNRILEDIADHCNFDFRFSSHSLRKTFGYHQMMMSGNDPRKLVLLQKMFGHSSMNETLCYIGLTKEEMTEAYANLNLGGNGYDYQLAALYEAPADSTPAAI